MLPRDRILATLEFRPPDVIPLQIFPAPGGLNEHGQKLVDLIKECGHDFSDLSDLELPEPPGPEDFDADGTYHAFETDEWGTKWEYRIFGIWGHPVEWPLNDLSKLDSYKAPPSMPSEGPEFEKAKATADLHKQKHYLLEFGGLLFEQLHSVRRFEEVLMDIMLDTPEINRIADMITEYIFGNVQRALALDADGVSFGDDFGTQTGLMLSPDVWRRFFKPRYKILFDPILKAGKHIFFHCCGQITVLFEDFKELGVSAIWPQLPVYNLRDLSKRCRELEIGVQLHPDRGDLMQKGKPKDIREYIHKLLEAFETASGGSWLYIEIDPGFPYTNVEALFEIAMELRR